MTLLQPYKSRVGRLRVESSHFCEGHDRFILNPLVNPFISRYKLLARSSLTNEKNINSFL